MSGINSINRLIPGLIEKINPAGSESKADKAIGGGNFTEIFSNMLESVDMSQKDAAQIQEAFLNGEPVEIHEVMIKAQEAGISMDLLLEIRNKLVNAYNEIMRMPM